MKTLFTISLLFVLGSAFAQECPGGCCAGKAAAVKPFDSKDAKFLAMANEMMMASEGKGSMACCKEEAKVAVMEKNTHKLYVSGKGYEMFCCPDMAGDARKAYVAKGVKVGKVQKISRAR